MPSVAAIGVNECAPPTTFKLEPVSDAETSRALISLSSRGAATAWGVDTALAAQFLHVPVFDRPGMCGPFTGTLSLPPCTLAMNQ